MSKGPLGNYRFLSYGDACYLTRSMDEKATAHEAPPERREASAGAEMASDRVHAATTTQQTERPKVLLHSCCAPCSGAMIEEMVEKQDADVTIFFYNPNIHPRAEYELRKRENEEYAKRRACRLLMETTTRVLKTEARSSRRNAVITACVRHEDGPRHMHMRLSHILRPIVLSVEGRGASRRFGEAGGGESGVLMTTGRRTSHGSNADQQLNNSTNRVLRVFLL